jgi:acyl-CoA dehydrogenase
VPAANILGGEGQAFAISQTRLGGGRIHHAMRTVGQARKALDMMVERALSRTTQRSRLADKQAVQAYIADSYAELMQFRLYVLYVAWRIDRLKDYSAVRHDIAAVKVLTPGVLHNIAQRAMQVHGALSTTGELPLNEMFSGSMILGLADGPTEVHRTTVAKALLRDGKPAEGMWPSEWLVTRQEKARVKYAEFLTDGDLSEEEALR